MNNQDPQSAQRKQQGATTLGVEGSFPCILHTMLDEMDAQGLSHVVSWQPHGRCFVVHRRKTFVETALPTFFRTKKFASFQRQLNLYGFHRVTTGQDRGGYYHDLFLRGRKDLCKLIVRQQVKGTGPRKPDAPEQEPNFYEMEFMPGPENIEDQKMPPPSTLGSTLAASAATSLSGMMMESAARVPQIPAESSLLASLYLAPSMSSFPAFGGTSNIMPTLQQQHQQSLALASSVPPGFDPLIAALRAAANPYNYPFSASMLSSSTATPLFQRPGAESYGFAASNFPFQSFGGFDAPRFTTMPGAASMPRSSLRDILQRDSIDASIFHIAASQHGLHNHQEVQERPSKFRAEPIDPASAARRSNSPHESSRSDDEASKKRSARKRRSR